MIIPASIINVELVPEEEIETSRTYKLSETRVQGFVDGLEAVKQAIYKVLSTEKYEYPIYSFSYGIELESLIGKDRDYVKIELKRRIQESLTQDERITGVENFQFTENGDILNCTFDVQSIYGSLSVSQEVI